jgi:hypothetical protein
LSEASRTEVRLAQSKDPHFLFLLAPIDKSHGIKSNVGSSGASTRPNVLLDGAARAGNVRVGGCDFSRQIP